MLFLTCFYLLGVFGSTPGLLKVPSAFPSSEGQCWEHSGLMMVVIKIVPEIGWWHSAITTAFTGFLFWCNIPVLFGRKQKHPFFLLLNKYFCLFICHLPFSSIYELLRKTEKKTRGKRERDNGEENNTSFCYSEAFFFFSTKARNIIVIKIQECSLQLPFLYTSSNQFLLHCVSPKAAKAGQDETSRKMLASGSILALAFEVQKSNGKSANLLYIFIFLLPTSLTIACNWCFTFWRNFTLLLSAWVMKAYTGRPGLLERAWVVLKEGCYWPETTSASPETKSVNLCRKQEVNGSDAVKLLPGEGELFYQPSRYPAGTERESKQAL